MPMTPILKRVVNHLWYDQGVDPPRGFKLPEFFENDPLAGTIDWKRVAKFLKTLTPQAFEDLCIGDEEDMEFVVKNGGVEGEYAHRALDTIFLVITS